MSWDVIIPLIAAVFGFSVCVIWWIIIIEKDLPRKRQTERDAAWGRENL